MKKVFVSFALLALALSSCQGKGTSTEATSDSLATDSVEQLTEATNAQEGLFGTYEGTIPGADTSIQTTITLYADGTYSKQEEFSKEGASPMEERGVYRLEGTLLTLVTPSSGMETYYQVGEGKLTMLDQTTKEVPTGELAPHYELAKK